jgi:hypothetical protein
MIGDEKEIDPRLVRNSRPFNYLPNTPIARKDDTKIHEIMLGEFANIKCQPEISMVMSWLLGSDLKWMLEN